MTIRLLFAACVVMGLAQPVAAQNRYTLTSSEHAVITTWFYEPFGYLDACVNDVGVSARQALALNAALNITEWIRTNTKHANTWPSDWQDCAMFWWVRSNSGITINAGNRPPEAAAWAAVLIVYDDSIVAAFARASVLQRNQGCDIPTYDSSGQVSGSIPCGSQLQAQDTLFSKVIPVLQ